MIRDSGKQASRHSDMLAAIVLGSSLATRARDAVVRVALASVLTIVGVRLDDGQIDLLP
jgi:hypothetical protein